MVRFRRIAVIGGVPLSASARDALQHLSAAAVQFPGHVAMDGVGGVIGDADALITAFGIAVTAQHMDTHSSLRFIAMAASRYAEPSRCPIDLRAAADRGITVSTLEHYGDEATVEWMVMRLIEFLRRGIDGARIDDDARELCGRSLGLVGMGHIGRRFASVAHGFGVVMRYWSRRRRPEVEDLAAYCDLDELVATSDIVSLQLGSGARLMTRDRFALMGPGTVLLNISNGEQYADEDLAGWLSGGRRFALLDRDASAACHLPPGTRGLLRDHAGAAQTREMAARRERQLIENLRAYLDGEPIRVAAAAG